MSAPAEKHKSWLNTDIYQCLLYKHLIVHSLLLTGRNIQKKTSKENTLGFLTSKGSLTASEDDGSDVAVGFKGIQGLSHLPHQPITQSVESLGPVQLDETHIALLTSLLHQNILILTTCKKREPTPMVRWDFYALSINDICRVHPDRFQSFSVACRMQFHTLHEIPAGKI